jgi:hypothetical protein
LIFKNATLYDSPSLSGTTIPFLRLLGGNHYRKVARICIIIKDDHPHHPPMVYHFEVFLNISYIDTTKPIRMRGNSTKKPSAVSGLDAYTGSVPTTQNAQQMNSTRIQIQTKQAVILLSSVIFRLDTVIY